MSQSDVGRQLAERIRTARSRIGISQGQVAERLGIPRSAVSDIEAAKREVSAAELVVLADMFGETLEALLGVGGEPSNGDDMMFRADQIAPAARAQLSRWMSLCETYQQLEGDAGDVHPPDLRPVQGILSSFEQAVELADQERARLELGPTPAHVLLGVLEERLGVKVLFLDLDDAISGASTTSARFGPAVLINRRHSPGRRAFTMAHELFHLLVRGPVVGSGRPPAWRLCEGLPQSETKDRVEQLADRFAGRLLVPPDHFIERLRSIVKPGAAADPVDLIAVARYFGVSVQAVFVQLALGKLASWDLAMQGYRDPAFQESVAQAGVGDGPEPQRFRRLAIKAYLAERISRARLAELLEIDLVDVEEVLRQYGAGGGGGDRGISVALPR